MLRGLKKDGARFEEIWSEYKKYNTRINEEVRCEYKR